MRRVIDDSIERQTILQQLYNDSGHKRRESTYQQVADQYWLDNLHVEVKAYVQSYEECQCHDFSRSEEALNPTWVAILWQKVVLDVVYITPCEGYRFLVVACYDLSS